MQYIVDGFWAAENRKTCVEYLDGHVQVLEEFGITNVTTNSDYWKDREDVYVIICRESESGQIVAGIRIEPKVESKLLPIESAISSIDIGILNEVAESSRIGKAVEICGLWNSRKVFGKDISRFLSECAVAILPHLEARIAYCLVAHYTLELSQSLGFCIIDEIGTNGWVPYPNETYKAFSMVIRDIESLSFGNPEVVERIHSFRFRPNGTAVITTTRYVSEISYNLF
jgi:hypothetical protein